jgi:hypothetical protein
MQVLNLSKNQKREDKSLTWNPLPPLLPPRYILVNTTSQKKEIASSIRICVKRTSLHFIVDSGIQKNFISAEVVKQLALPTTSHPQTYTIGWLLQGSDLHINQQCRLSYEINPFKDEVL